MPDFEAEVERFAKRAAARARSRRTRARRSTPRAFRPVCFQHEIDHLDGVLFIDRISRLKRNLYVRKRRKQLRQEAAESESPQLA